MGIFLDSLKKGRTTIVVVVLAIVCLLVWKFMPNTEKRPEATLTVPSAVTPAVPDTAETKAYCEDVFKTYVVAARVYLDYHPKNKLGLIYVNGQRVQTNQLADKTQDELIRIVAEDWFAWIYKVPNFTSLSDEEKAVFTLIAMRFGKERFLSSDFYKAYLNDNAKASDIYIQNVDEDGKCNDEEIMFYSLEPFKYTWMLQLLWDKPSLVKDLKSLPCKSYLIFNALYLYEGLHDNNGGAWRVKSFKPLFPKNWKEIMKRDNHGLNPLVSEILK